MDPNGEATGVKEALPTEFKSKAIDFTVTPSGTITPTATAGSGSGGYDYNGTGSGDGDGTDGDDAENHDGTDSDTGSTSATNARTADNSPDCHYDDACKSFSGSWRLCYRQKEKKKKSKKIYGI